MSDKFSVDDLIEEYSNRLNKNEDSEKKLSDSKTVEFQKKKSDISFKEKSEYNVKRNK